MPTTWHKSIVVYLFKKGKKWWAIFIGVCLYSRLVVQFFNILLNRYTPYANEIIGEYYCGYRSLTNQDIGCGFLQSIFVLPDEIYGIMGYQGITEKKRFFFWGRQAYVQKNFHRAEFIPRVRKNNKPIFNITDLLRGDYMTTECPLTCAP